MTVIIAFIANLLVAAGKTVASMITGSASMTAEAAHSRADSGNQILLLIAERRSGRRRDLSHAMGYGREAHVWSMSACLHLEYVGPERLYLVAAVDLTGDRREHGVAVALRAVEHDIEDHERIEEAVLTLSTPDEPTRRFGAGPRA